MYCVIQEIETKKANRNGHHKELISEYRELIINGIDMSYYRHSYSDIRFERLVKKAYKVSIHESYREKGKVKKKQYSLCTVNYYDIADGWFSVYDYCGQKIKKLAQELGCEEEHIYNLIYSKMDPLIDNIINEFKQTEEYITHSEHSRITTLYAANKANFTNKYECDKGMYDQIYDVFGSLINKEKLKKVQEDYKARKEYEEKSRSYQEQNYSNYYDSFFNKSSRGSSSYSNYNHSNHNIEDRDTLKQFYRVLSKKFHPDANPDKDTSKEMQLLNQLKNDWGV